MVDQQIREKIAAYVAGDLDIEGLEAWLSAETWDLEDENASTRRLAAEAMHLAAEGANGDWDDMELREALGALSRAYWIEQAPRRVITGSTGMVIRQGRWSVAPGRSLATARV